MIENTQTNVATHRIIGAFVKQQWGGRKGDDAIYVSEEEFDATAAILLMPHNELVELQDSDETTDQIGREHVQWDGPCEVRIVDSIQKFFGVETLEDVTLDALEKSKDLANPQSSQQRTLTLSIKVIVKAANDADMNEFIENLDYSVRSNTAGVVVTDTEIVDSDDQQSVQHQSPRD